MENKLKHLEFIQNAITRMSNSTFLIKGWSITILSALFAFAKNESNKDYALLAYFTVHLFWYLNGIFLLQERRFRELYNSVRLKRESQIDFSMDISGFKDGKCTLLSSLFAKSIWPLYTSMILISILIIYVF